jgi:hypothetical protein
LKSLLSRHLATRVDQIQLTYGVYNLSDSMLAHPFSTCLRFDFTLLRFFDILAKSLAYYKIRKDSHLQMIPRFSIIPARIAHRTK